MLRLLLDPHCPSDRREVISALHYGWGNRFWSASTEYVLACWQHASVSDGPILECGSGLTTLILGAVAQKRGLGVWTLEHNEKWAGHIQRYLHRYGIRSVNLLVHPLRDYGSYCWYAPPLEKIPKMFGLVVCDGPPYNTRGGRYGLMPVMGERLPAGTTILLDDAGRAPERRIAERWAGELGTTVTTLGTGRRGRYGLINVPKSNYHGALVTEAGD
jgi:hypothetical protein